MQSDELQAEQVHFPARNPIASRKWRWSIDDDHVKRAAKTLSKKKKTKTSYCRKNRTELQWSHWHQSVFLATTTAAADDVIAQLFSLSSWMGLAMVIGSWSQPSRPVGLAIRPGLSLSLSSQIVQPQKRVLCQVLHFWSVLWWARYLCQVNEIQHLSELGQTVGWDEFGDCFNVVPKVNLWTTNLVHFTYEECQHRMVFLTVFVVHLKKLIKLRQDHIINTNGWNQVLEKSHQIEYLPHIFVFT